MQHYYFMNKPEVVNVDNEKDLKDWIAYSTRAKKFWQRDGLLVQMDECQEKHKKRKRFFYFLNGLILLGMFIFYQIMDNKNLQNYYVDDGWQYYLQLHNLTNKQGNLVLYLQNILDKPSQFRFALKIQFFTAKEDLLLFKEPQKTVYYDKLFRANSKDLIFSKSFVALKDVVYIGFIINDRITLYQKINQA